MPGKLLAILGRGIQQNQRNGLWEPTEDIEMTDEKFAHLAVRRPVDDNDPHCIVGGGWLNVFAAVELWKTSDPRYDLVCAEYGNRSKYLREVGGPSGSWILADKFIRLVIRETGENPTVSLFDEKTQAETCGTNQELRAMFTLAIEHNIAEIHLVTVAVHLPRTLLFAQRHALTNPDFRDLKIVGHASELVLAESDPARYGERAASMFSSQAYQRNLRKEIEGMNALLAGTYREVSSAIR